VAPAVVAVLFVLGAGLGSAVLQSVGLIPLVGDPALQFTGYVGEREVLTAAGLSLLIAAASTSVAALVGLSTALLLVGSGRGRRMLAALVTASIPFRTWSARRRWGCCSATAG